MHDFFVFPGKESYQGDPKNRTLSKSAQVVATLVEYLPKRVNQKVFFDNWYSTLELFHHLKDIKLLAVGTIRENGLLDCPICDDKTLSKEGRGAYDEVNDQNRGLSVVKWNYISSANVSQSML